MTPRRTSPFTTELRSGYGWAGGGVALMTGLFWLGRGALDKGQASLLYLPVVIACAVRFGFGPAVLGAVLSFACWDFFFLPPYRTLLIADPRDWLSLLVFLVAAITTARLAARARGQAQEAEARERETATLYAASEALSGEVDAERLLPTLAAQIVRLCDATRCVVLHRPHVAAPMTVVASVTDRPLSPAAWDVIATLAAAACEHNQVIGFGTSRNLWARAVQPLGDTVPETGVFVPLRAQNKIVGALHVGPRRDALPFSPMHERLILTLSNHAAVVLARQALARDAAQAEALRETDALKDALLSMVSHELRTPLAAIKATASGLRQQGTVWDDAARADAILSIDREADRLTALVSNLLDLSRLEAGAWQPVRDWCDLGEIVGTALDRLPPPDASRVRVSAPANLPLVRVDYVQIALVLTNLLDNAAKYAPPDTPIDLSLSRVPDAVRVDVRDFGAGLCAGEEEWLFGKFQRSVRHAGGIIHGTGLGLALCRAIVDAHGGRIWAANAPAGEPPGAVFSFLLPVDSFLLPVDSFLLPVDSFLLPVDSFLLPVE